MKQHPVVSQAQWLEERKALLEREKALTRLNDEISELRRQLPWVRVEQMYSFDTSEGVKSLAELFAGRHQLVVYHFMFGPDWEQGCASCSFWADHLSGLSVHLAHRDISLVVVSRAALQKLLAYQRRMGWVFDWVSSLDTTFNRDFKVTFTGQEQADGEVFYNYQMCHFPLEEAPGLSVFYRDPQGRIYHTYSCYGRGLDCLNTAYQIMDRTPLGRNEQGLVYPMAWLRRHDQYEN